MKKKKKKRMRNMGTEGQIRWKLRVYVYGNRCC